MQDVIDLVKVWALNGSAYAIITLTTVKDVVAITLGIVSIISTAIIIYKNVRRA